jgi:hypothetical protein
MISEIDIRDWEKIDTKTARECVDSLDDFARMGTGVNAHGNVNFLMNFITQVELIQKKQVKQVAALFKQ